MSDNLVVCARCGGINRIAPDRPALAARCGKCKSKLFAGHPEDVDAAVFNRQVSRSTIPVTAMQ